MVCHNNPTSFWLCQECNNYLVLEKEYIYKQKYMASIYILNFGKWNIHECVWNQSMETYSNIVAPLVDW